MQLTFKLPPGVVADEQLDGSLTVLDVKALLAEICDIAPNAQRFIYKGKVLKDGLTLDDAGVVDGAVIHVVRGAPPPSAATAAPNTNAPNADAANGNATNGSAANGNANASGDAPPATAAHPGAAPPPQAAAAAAAGGTRASPFGGSSSLGLLGLGSGQQQQQQMQQMLLDNPEMMQQMMNSPIMQNIMNNPEMMRSMLLSNPQMQQVMDDNPELAHVLNDPALLRQSLETARNPQLMREMMRNTDRAMSNIEMHPEGFNMLRRMYNTIQQPLNDLTPSSMLADEERDSTSHAAQTEIPHTPNTAALPNPWAAPAARSPAASPFTNAGCGSAAAPSNPLGGAGGFSSSSLRSLLGGPRAQSNPRVPFNPPVAATPPASTTVPSPTRTAASTPTSTPTTMPIHTPTSIPSPTPPSAASAASAATLPPLQQRLRAMMQEHASLGGAASAAGQPEGARAHAHAHAHAASQAAANAPRPAQTHAPSPTTATSAAAGVPHAHQGPSPFGSALGNPMVGALLQDEALMRQLMGRLGSVQVPTPPPAQPGSTAPASAISNSDSGRNAHEVAAAHYASQLSTLADMGFFDADANLRALMATGGNVQAAVERLLS